jgi:hypothetical protein
VHEAKTWSQPEIEWLQPFDLDAWQAAAATRQLLVTWPPTEYDTTETDCFRALDEFWIVQRDIGAVHFRLTDPRVFAHPWPGADEARFRQYVTRSWFPAIYPLWGRQVLHASAVVCPRSGVAVAFTGPTRAGKSTTAFGLSRRGAWVHAADDTLAFSIAEGAAAPVRLHPIPNEARLRPATADYYGRTDSPAEMLAWPAGDVALTAVYVLDGDETCRETALFTRLRAADALPLLLQQAFALSFNMAAYNQRLMKDYLALASRVPVFGLRYRRSFDVAEELFAALDAHLQAELGVACPSAGSASD